MIDHPVVHPGMEQKFHDRPPTPQQQEKVLLLFSAVGLVAAYKKAIPNDRNIHIELEFGGHLRPAILHLPPAKESCDAEGSCSKKFPLVFDLHPLGYNAEMQQQQSGFSDLADKEGYVKFFYPAIDIGRSLYKSGQHRW